MNNLKSSRLILKSFNLTTEVKTNMVIGVK